jgi:hypothetical protein
MSVAASRRALAAASRDRRFCSDRQLPAGSARSGLRSSRRARGQAGDVGGKALPSIPSAQAGPGWTKSGDSISIRFDDDGHRRRVEIR